jgi:hypothetical protein
LYHSGSGADPGAQPEGRQVGAQGRVDEDGVGGRVHEGGAAEQDQQKRADAQGRCQLPQAVHLHHPGARGRAESARASRRRGGMRVRRDRAQHQQPQRALGHTPQAGPLPRDHRGGRKLAGGWAGEAGPSAALHTPPPPRLCCVPHPSCTTPLPRAPPQEPPRKKVKLQSREPKGDPDSAAVSGGESTGGRVPDPLPQQAIRAPRPSPGPGQLRRQRRPRQPPPTPPDPSLPPRRRRRG